MKVTKYEFYTLYPKDIEERIKIIRKQLNRRNLTDNPQELLRKRKLFNQRLREMKSNPRKHYQKMAELIRQEISAMDFQLNARTSDAVERYMLNGITGPLGPTGSNGRIGNASASKSTT